MRVESSMDRFLGGFGRALHTLCAVPAAIRTAPEVLRQAAAVSEELSDSERAHAAALMRVNHVGEVCAQALYQGQALATSEPQLKHFFLKAAQEEADHLAWTKERIDQLGGRVSLLNPLWYGGSLAIGFVSGRFGDRNSLGFMRETERQVEAHLDTHLDTLPAADLASRQVLEAMKYDESEHARSATELGASELPAPIHWLMRLSAKVMTKTAYHL